MLGSAEAATWSQGGGVSGGDETREALALAGGRCLFGPAGSGRRLLRVPAWGKMGPEATSPGKAKSN